MTDTSIETPPTVDTPPTVETPRRPFAVRDAVPLVLGLGLIATGFLLFFLDIGGPIGFVIALPGYAFWALFIHRENRRKGLPNGGAAYYAPWADPRYSGAAYYAPWTDLSNPANPMGYFNPISPNYVFRHK